MKNPPFAITNTIIDLVAEIAELMGKLTSIHQLSASPTLRRANRIRTIHGSLAIEQNTLSLEQVTAVINGKHVLAPPKDIAEVKNAYEIYERLDELDPYNMDDLLAAHGIMTRGLVEESGYFRSRPVAVVDQQGNILHFGTLPDYVPGLTKDLLTSIIIFMAHSLAMSILWIMLQSPDLAITEAAVGAGISSLLMFVTLKKIHAIDVQKGGDGHGKDPT